MNNHTHSWTLTHRWCTTVSVLLFDLLESRRTNSLTAGKKRHEHYFLCRGCSSFFSVSWYCLLVVHTLSLKTLFRVKIVINFLSLTYSLFIDCQIKSDCWKRIFRQLTYKHGLKKIYYTLSQSFFLTERANCFS